MRRRLLPGLLCLLLAFSLTLPTRGAADQTDPVLAKSYLDQVAAAELKASVNDAAIRAMNAVYGKKLLALTEAVGDHRLRLAQKDTGNRAAAGQTLLLKQGDQLTLLPGAQLLLRSGAAKTDCADLVNKVTDGLKKIKDN